MAIAPISNRPIGAWRDLPGLVGGHTYSSMDAFKKAFGSGHAVMRPGDKVSIKIPAAVGALTPSLLGLNKKSPFTAKYADGKLTITAKADAKLGTTDKVGIKTGALVAPGRDASSISRFTLEVGIGRIRMG